MAHSDFPLPPLISVVVPVYKEEESIRPFLVRIVPVLEKIGTYEIIFCLDPSPDRTEQVVMEAIAENPSIGVLTFSRRFGQAPATMAGLRHCSGENCVMIDVDLQDPPELIGAMYAKLCEGYDVVLTRRKSRKGESLIKKATSYLGYRLIRSIASVNIPADTGDFRVISRRVMDEIARLKEGHSFLRGLVNYVGFRHTIIEYNRDERCDGEAKYHRYFGSLKIALDGIFGFSNVPLTVVFWLGLLVCCASVALIFFTVLNKLLFASPYPLGVPTMTIALLFIGGVQLISIGIIGEYIGRIYDEVRARPNYIVDKAVNIKCRPPIV